MNTKNNSKGTVSDGIKLCITVIIVILLIVFTISHRIQLKEYNNCDTEIELTYFFEERTSANIHGGWVYWYKARYIIDGVEYKDIENYEADCGRSYKKAVKLNSDNPSVIYDVKDYKYNFPLNTYIGLGAMWLMAMVFIKDKTDSDEE